MAWHGMDAYMSVVIIIVVVVVALQLSVSLRFCWCAFHAAPMQRFQTIADPLPQMAAPNMAQRPRCDGTVWTKHGRHDEKCDGAARKRLILTKDFD
jgi:hypothetical protein